MTSAYYEVLAQAHYVLYCISAFQSGYVYGIYPAHISQFPIPVICVSHQV